MAFTASIANFAITLHAPTSTELDTVHDALVALSDPWDSYTPTWTNSTTNPTIGNGTLSGAYIQVGKFVVFRVSIGMGSTTTFGTGAGYSFGLPVASNEGTGLWTGGATLNDTSASGNRMGRIVWLNAGSTVGMADEATGARVSSTVPFTFASGDQITIKGIYEAA
jgi:hypothetical protein